MRTLPQLEEILVSDIIIIDVTTFNAIFGWHFNGSADIKICRPEFNSLICVSQGEEEEEYWISIEEEANFMLLLNELIIK